jgi:hypothetical protein
LKPFNSHTESSRITNSIFSSPENHTIGVWNEGNNYYVLVFSYYTVFPESNVAKIEFL